MNKQLYTRKNLCYKCDVWAGACYLKPTADNGKQCGCFRPKIPKRNKFNAVRAWSEICEREFASKLERDRGEQLRFLELAGEISDLEYQVPFELFNDKSYPEVGKATIIVDFCYKDKDGTYTLEDTKGKMTREARLKLILLYLQWHVKVKLTYE